jgi:hypothetical protein
MCLAMCWGLEAVYLDPSTQPYHTI